MIKEYLKGVHTEVSKDFSSTEYDCPCKRPDCKVTLIDEELVALDQKMRDLLGVPLTIDSGFRCQGHQEDLAKAGLETATHSQHLLGKASDKWASGVNGIDLARIAKEAGFQAIGVAPTWIHSDTRADKLRIWFYRGVSNARDVAEMIEQEPKAQS